MQHPQSWTRTFTAIFTEKEKVWGEVQKMCRDGVSPSMPGPDYSSQLEIDGRVVCEYIVKESKRKNTTRQQYASAYRKSKTPQRALFCVYSNAFSRIKYCESVPSNFLLECKRSPGINTCQWLPEGHLLGMPFVHLGLSFR
jgi:hypothetical protein